MRHVIIAAAAAALTMLLALPAQAGMVEDCNQEYDPDLGISGCAPNLHQVRSGFIDP